MKANIDGSTLTSFRQRKISMKVRRIIAIALAATTPTNPNSKPEPPMNAYRNTVNDAKVRMYAVDRNLDTAETERKR